jgi:hypothetical protein
MLSKLITIVTMVIFLVVISTPAFSHSGRIPNIIEEPSDEDPWGGEHHLLDTPGNEKTSINPPKLFYGTRYFISIAWYYFWQDFEAYIIKTSDAGPGNNLIKNFETETPQPEPINNNSTGSGN